MLTVKTKLGPSSIAGTGLFANEFIPKGAIVWRMDPNIDREYSQREFDSGNELEKEFLTTYCFKFNGRYILCVDNARFFNHSDNPNCYSADFNETTLGCTRALRDIQVGEELTDNYAGFGLTEADKQFNLDIY